MASTYKPIINRINAFDCNVGTTIYFYYNGPQVFSNQLTIRDSETLNIVYQYKTPRQMNLEHTLNLEDGTSGGGITGDLQNGKQYQATLVVYDKDNESSLESDPVTFWCFTTPVLTIENEDILSGIIPMSSIYLRFHYYQQEGEPLNEYYIQLFDEGKNLLQQSSIFYGSSSDEYYEYRIEGLVNNNLYYVNVICTTFNGMSISTGEVEFSVKYDKMGAGALVYLRDLGSGRISIASNFKIVDTDSYPEEPVYINGNEIDLRDPDSYVDFFDGFTVSGNYELKTDFRAPQDTFKILFRNEKNELVRVTYNYFDIDYEFYSVRKYYFKLEVTKREPSLTVFTKLFDKVDESQNIVLVVRHVNGFYSIDCKIDHAINPNRLPYKLKGGN